jgi:hypothetical protein
MATSCAPAAAELRAVWQPRYKNGYSDQAWTYGITLEAMAQAHLLTKRKEMPGYMKRAADWLLGNLGMDPPRDGSSTTAIWPDARPDSRMSPRQAVIAATGTSRTKGFRRQVGEQDATEHLTSRSIFRTRGDSSGICPRTRADGGTVSDQVDCPRHDRVRRPLEESVCSARPGRRRSVLCGALMAEFGAEVIKTEMPGRGDDLRRLA